MYLIGELDNGLQNMVLIFLTKLQLISLHTLCNVYTPYRRNWLSVVKALIEKQNVDVNSVDSDGYSPLHKACL